MPLNIVLIEPEIHTNTGNIGRLSLATGAILHLVKPFGFEINDSRLKRAGLDYWKHISLVIYENLDDFFDKNNDKDMVFLSSHGKQLKPRQVHYIVSQSLQRASIVKRKQGPHLLRHSGASLKAQRGENLIMIQHLLGHENLNTTRRYLHFAWEDLKEMVDEKRFRKDLFFRLNVIPFHIPPLRKRTEEIPALINFFLKQCNDKCSANKLILPKAVDRLCRYSFPGNIRELANLVEQLVVLTPGKRIDLKDLPSHILMEESNASPDLFEDEWNLPKTMARLEKEMILRALKTYGSQRKAAVPLNIDQSTLARKAKRYGIRTDAIVHYDD